MFRQLIKWSVRSLATVAILVVGLITLLALLRRDHKTSVELPRPTGNYAIGRAIYAWVNNSETDELAPSAGAKREVLVWIWYPSALTTSAARVEYLPALWRVADAQHSGILMSQFFTRDLSLVHAHSTSDPDISSNERSYPVVIMRAGGGALTTDFTTLAEDLASHGYFVVGFDAPYRTGLVVLPDRRVVTRPPANDPEDLPADQADRLVNRLLPMWTSDTKFVVNQLQRLNAADLKEDDPSGRFRGRLDMQRLGMFGHSFGGAQTLQFCHEDRRCKAGIDIDGDPHGSVVQEGLQQPVMFLLSDHSRELSDPARSQILANIQSIYSHLPNGRLLIAIRGANHFSFSDQILLKSPYLIGLLRRLGFGNLDGRRGLAITAEYVHTFFDVYLKDAPSTLLTNIARQYSEVQFEPL